MARAVCVLRCVGCGLRGLALGFRGRHARCKRSKAGLDGRRSGLEHEAFVALRIARDRADRWFCSELAHAALASGGVDLLERVAAYWVAPGDIYRSPKLRGFVNTITKGR